MSVYYNFTIINLDKFQSPPVDENGQYDFISYPDIEDVSVGRIESAKLNYAASEMVDLLLSSRLVRNDNKEFYMTFFGNLFWSGDDEFKMNRDLYLKDAWVLKESNNPVDFYSISTNSMKHIISLEKDIDFKMIMEFFGKVSEQKRSFNICFLEFFEVTQNWLALYKLATIKGAGIVYDIG